MSVAVLAWIWIFPAFLAVLAAWRDWRTEEVPDGLCLLAGVSGLAYCVASGVAGMASGGAALLVACMIGVGLYAVGAWGGGDVKLLAGLSLWSGWPGVWGLLAWMALSGLPLALIGAARGKRIIPYAPAIACGFVVQSGWPRLLPGLLGL